MISPGCHHALWGVSQNLLWQELLFDRRWAAGIRVSVFRPSVSYSVEWLFDTYHMEKSICAINGGNNFNMGTSHSACRSTNLGFKSEQTWLAPLSKKYDNFNVYTITLISLVSRDRCYTCQHWRRCRHWFLVTAWYGIATLFHTVITLILGAHGSFTCHNTMK